MGIVRRMNPGGRAVWQVRVSVQGHRPAVTVDVNPRARDESLGAAEEVERALRAQLTEELRCDVRPSRQPTDDYLRAWLASRPLRPTTAALYQSVVDQYLLPALGRTPLRDLAPGQCERAWGAPLAAGHTRMAQVARTVLHAALADAVRDGALPANPVDRTRPVRRPRVGGLGCRGVRGHGAAVPRGWGPRRAGPATGGENCRGAPALCCAGEGRRRAAPPTGVVAGGARSGRRPVAGRRLGLFHAGRGPSHPRVLSRAHETARACRRRASMRCATSARASRSGRVCPSQWRVSAWAMPASPSPGSR